MKFLIYTFLMSLEPGKLMTKYYLKFDTMKHIMRTPENCSLEDALNVICHAEEIACMHNCVVVICPSAIFIVN